MEPFMKLEVTVDERYLHGVLGDLAQHRSDVLEVTQRAEWKVCRNTSDGYPGSLPLLKYSATRV